MVCMYCDDRGVSKNLPINRRAGELCAQNGSTIEVSGDTFVEFTDFHICAPHHQPH